MYILTCPNQYFPARLAKYLTEMYFESSLQLDAFVGHAMPLMQKSCCLSSWSFVVLSTAGANL